MEELRDFNTSIPREGFKWLSVRPVSDDFTISVDHEDFLVNPTSSADHPRADDPRWDDKSFREKAFRKSKSEVEEQHRTVQPFAEVVPVFDRFANIGNDKESILKFANEYGSLDAFYWGATKKCRLRRMKIPKAVSLESFRLIHLPFDPSWLPFLERAFEGGFIVGDPLATWQAELVAITTCVILFRAMLRNDKSTIEAMFDRELGEFSSKVYKDARFYTKFNDKWEYRPRRATPKEMAGALICYLTRARLKEGCRSSLAFESDRFSFATAPNTFRDAIWHEFAHAAQDMKNYRECETCRFLFCVGDDGSRKSRRYCSDACRMKALRERQSKARELRAGGMHLRQITKKLGVDNMETVKAWVANVPKP